LTFELIQSVSQRWALAQGSLKSKPPFFNVDRVLVEFLPLPSNALIHELPLLDKT